MHSTSRSEVVGVLGVNWDRQNAKLYRKEVKAAYNEGSRIADK